MKHLIRTLSASLALSCLPTVGFALDNDPQPQVHRVNHCGTFDRQYFLDNRNPQWGDTLTDQLSRAADAKCQDLESMGIINYSPPTITYGVGRAQGVFSDGLNHNDPYNTGSYDGYNNSGQLIYALTGAKFACTERVHGTTASVAPSLPCPPFSDDVPGGNGSQGSNGNSSGGTGAGSGGLINLPNLATASAVLIKGNNGNPSTTGPVGVYLAHARDIMQLAAYHQGEVGGLDQASELFLLAHDKFEDAIRVTPFEIAALKGSATALVGLARLADGDEAIEKLQAAEKRLRIIEGQEKGLASYNLACIMARQNKSRDAKKWMLRAKRFGYLPSLQHILADDDLANVRRSRWFRSLFAQTHIERR